LVKDYLKGKVNAYNGENLAPSNLHLFLHLKKILSTQILMSDQERNGDVQDWLKDWVATLF
jgi:hypothetical protein